MAAALGRYVSTPEESLCTSRYQFYGLLLQHFLSRAVCVWDDQRVLDIASPWPRPGR